MKVIFLDIDGVLNHPGCYQGRSGTRIPAAPSCVAALNKIIAATDAKIVLSSSWRYHGLSFCRWKLHEWGVNIEGRIIGATPRRKKDQGFYANRGEEIQAFVAEYQRHTIHHFIILDDSSDMDGVLHKFYQVDGSTGLTDDDADVVIEKLNNCILCS